MTGRVYPSIAVMAAVTYLIRALPLTLLRREIKSPFVRSFLHYVPYVALSVMTFPAILGASSSLWPGLAAFVAAVCLAWRGRNLFQVALGACLAVFVMDLLIR